MKHTFPIHASSTSPESDRGYRIGHAFSKDLINGVRDDR
jgi:hypothetical protein